MANQCFENRTELKRAVRLYIQDPTSETNRASQTYGYPIGSWCIDNLTDLDFVFSGWKNAFEFVEDDVIRGNFSYDLTGWNTSKVTSMNGTFEGCNLCNPNISTWDVSRVTSMLYMFSYASSFNSDISKWNVSSVEYMRRMINGCSSFNSDISGWNVSSVVNMEHMFRDCSSFNSDISKWGVSSVWNMAFMFRDATSFNQNLCSWGERIETGYYAAGMFEGSGCPVMTDPDLTATPPGPFCHGCADDGEPAPPDVPSPTTEPSIPPTSSLSSPTDPVTSPKPGTAIVDSTAAPTSWSSPLTTMPHSMASCATFSIVIFGPPLLSFFLSLFW